MRRFLHKVLSVGIDLCISHAHLSAMTVLGELHSQLNFAVVCLTLGRAAVGNRFMRSISPSNPLTVTVISMITHKGQVSNKAHHILHAA